MYLYLFGLGNNIDCHADFDKSARNDSNICHTEALKKPKYPKNAMKILQQI